VCFFAQPPHQRFLPSAAVPNIGRISEQSSQDLPTRLTAPEWALAQPLHHHFSPWAGSPKRASAARQPLHRVPTAMAPSSAQPAHHRAYSSDGSALVAFLLAQPSHFSSPTRGAVADFFCFCPSSFFFWFRAAFFFSGSTFFGAAAAFFAPSAAFPPALVPAMQTLLQLHRLRLVERAGCSGRPQLQSASVSFNQLQSAFVAIALASTGVPLASRCKRPSGSYYGAIEGGGQSIVYSSTWRTPLDPRHPSNPPGVSGSR
jgi:hypothetical protein